MNHELMTPSIFFPPWKLVRNRVKALIHMRNAHEWTDLAFPAVSCWIKGSISRMVVPVLSVRTRSNHRPVIFTYAPCLASGLATVGHLQRCITLWGIFELWLWQKAWLLMGVMRRCSGTGLGWEPARTVGSSRHHLWLRQHVLRSAPPPQRGRRLTRPKVNIRRWTPRIFKQPDLQSFCPLDQLCSALILCTYQNIVSHRFT